MVAVLQRLALGLVLIGAASALLLFSDLRSRVSATKSAAPDGATPAAARTVKIAVLQHASQVILDQGREGIFAGMAEHGWVRGKNLTARLYNAEGDIAVAQTMAQEMASGDYDLLVTISTVSMQTVANANRATQKPHVFGLVSDPYSTGTGISRENHLEHPAHLAGYGTLQPVAQSFKLAREMNPALATVGVVWNAAETNSEAQVKLARAACAQLGLKLVETTVDTSSAVSGAVDAVISRGAEAVWVPGDVMVLTAIDTLIAATRKAGIPTFTVIPPNTRRGALFDIGADYGEVGRLTGSLAGEILNGRSPATVAIDNVMPEVLNLNRQTLATLKGPWKIPAALAGRAQLVIDEQGKEHLKDQPAATVAPRKTASTPVPNPSGRRWKIAVLVFNETPPCEQTLEGMAAAWKRSALVAGRDYEIKIRSAQGDMSALSGITDAALTDGADIIVPLSTPTLQVAAQKVRETPIVFTLVANPIAAGAGKSYEDHLPNVTGIAVLAPAKEALDLLAQHFPQYRRLGTLYCPAETNSVDLKESLEQLCQQRGLTLETVAANTASDLPDAALSLMARPIDAVLQISDNLSSAGFSAIAKAARQAQKPLLSLNSTTVALGSPFGFGRDYLHAGEVTVPVIERIIRGEDPATIPFALPPEIVVSVSRANARAVGMTIPAGLLEKPTIVVD